MWRQESGPLDENGGPMARRFPAGLEAGVLDTGTTCDCRLNSTPAQQVAYQR